MPLPVSPPARPNPIAADNAGKVKGSLLLARIKYLRARGRESAERVLRRLSSTDQVLIRGVVLPNMWYPGDVLLRLDSTIAAILSSGDRKTMFLDMGRFSADTNLGPSGAQRHHLRQDDPHHLLGEVPGIFASQHGSGRRTYERLRDRAAVIRTFDADETDAEDCLTAVGWLERGIALSGGRAPRVIETQCRASGAAHCEYRCEWS